MTPSIDQHRYQEVIDCLCTELHEDSIAKVVDTPIDYAIARYQYPTQPTLSYSGFVKETARFFQYLYAHGMTIKQEISLSQAQTEAIAYLQTYQSLHGNGLDAAWIETMMHYEGNIESVLVQLAETIKSRQRESYIQWKCNTVLSRLNWQDKCGFAEHLLDELKDVLSPTILSCEAEQLVDQIPTLIQIHLNSSSHIEKILTQAKNFTSF